MPFRLEQPDPRGVPVTFADATASAFGAAATTWRGPVGIVDFNHDGRLSLFAAEGTNGFRFLANSNGVFQPVGNQFTNLPGNRAASAWWRT